MNRQNRKETQNMAMTSETHKTMNSNKLYDLCDDADYGLDLHTAASIGFEERIRDIIENLDDKSLLNNKNKCGWTPLMYAACNADLKVVLFLLEEGAEPNLKNQAGQTALILATKYGSFDVASLLIENGARIDEQDTKGWTALFHAAYFGYRSLVELLIEKGAQINFSDPICGMTPLMIVSAAGHEIIVKSLLQYGANPSCISKTGDTALSIAIREGHVKVKMTLETALSKKSAFSTKTALKVQQQPCALFGLLDVLKLNKYYHIFQTHQIDISQFWLLSEKDLKDIGIELLGPRKKIMATIARFHENMPLHGNSEEQVFTNKLLLNNQALQKQIKELYDLAVQEKKLKQVADDKYNEAVQALKFITETVKRTVLHSNALKDQLKETHLNLTKVLCSNTRRNLYEPSSEIDVRAMLYSMGEIIKALSEQITVLYHQMNFKNM